MMTFVQIFTSGILLYLNWPFNFALDESFGLIIDCHIRLRVFVVCDTSRYQIWIGKYGSVSGSPPRK